MPSALAKDCHTPGRGGGGLGLGLGETRGAIPPKDHRAAAKAVGELNGLGHAAG